MHMELTYMDCHIFVLTVMQMPVSHTGTKKLTKLLSKSVYTQIHVCLYAAGRQ